MRNINTYTDFINEEFFKRIFKSKKQSPESKKRIDICVEYLIKFLSDNDIVDWDDFENMKTFDREIVNRLIDKSVKDMSELEEVRFKIRLDLSNRKQLLKYKKELEDAEEYEKCAMIVKKLSK